MPGVFTEGRARRPVRWGKGSGDRRVTRHRFVEQTWSGSRPSISKQRVLIMFVQFGVAFKARRSSLKCAGL